MKTPCSITKQIDRMYVLHKYQPFVVIALITLLFFVKPHEWQRSAYKTKSCSKCSRSLVHTSFGGIQSNYELMNILNKGVDNYIFLLAGRNFFSSGIHNKKIYKSAMNTDLKIQVNLSKARCNCQIMCRTYYYFDKKVNTCDTYSNYHCL